MDAVREGKITPLFFGSAMNNFGVGEADPGQAPASNPNRPCTPLLRRAGGVLLLLGHLWARTHRGRGLSPDGTHGELTDPALCPVAELFLNTFIDMAQAPSTAVDRDGNVVDPVSEGFTGIVFKLQANMDPRHRDKVAFVRVRSGRFEKGMKVRVARTGKMVALARPSTMFGQERRTTEEAYAGDIIGAASESAARGHTRRCCRPQQAVSCPTLARAAPCRTEQPVGICDR